MSIAENVERTVVDCGGGWIYCRDGKNLPKPGKRYQVTAIWKDDDFEKRSVCDAVYGSDGQWHGENYILVPYEVVAWRFLPEPYKADMEGHRENTTLRALRAISDSFFCENLKNGSATMEADCEFGEKQISDKAWAAYRKEQRELRKSKKK